MCPSPLAETMVKAQIPLAYGRACQQTMPPWAVPSGVWHIQLSLASRSLSCLRCLRHRPLRRRAGRARSEKLAKPAWLETTRKGVAILSSLFVDTKNPTYVFNQGRCFEQNRRYEDAIARFDEYLQTGSMNLTPDDKRAAEQHMAHSKEMLDRERATSPEPVVARPTPAVTTTDAPAAESSPPEVVRTESRPTSAATGSGLRIAGIVTTSAGVAVWRQASLSVSKPIAF